MLSANTDNLATCNVTSVGSVWTDYLRSIPWLHDRQKVAVLHLIAEAGGVVWWRVGQGKTRIALALFKMLKEICERQGRSRYHHLTVFCRRAAFCDWEKEAEVAGVTLQLFSEAILARQTNEQIRSLLSPKTSFLIFDEGWLFKNSRSNRAIQANALARRYPSLTLSGSIMTAQNLADIYGQLFTVNQHTYVARNYTEFSEKFTQSFNTTGFPHTAPRKGAYSRIMQLAAPVCDVYFPKQSARRIQDSVVEVEPSPEQKDAFEELRESWALQSAGVELKAAPTVITKVQQISDGWINNGEGHKLHLPSPKASKAWAITEELLAAGERVVVWCAFRYDVEYLSSIFPVATLQLTSQKPFDVVAWEKRKADVCIATVGSGSSINHFAQVPYAIYFSHSPKWMEMQQSRGRTDRHSSTHDTAYYYYLQTKGSFDAQVLRYVRQSASSEGKLISLAEEIQAWIRREKKG